MGAFTEFLEAANRASAPNMVHPFAPNFQRLVKRTFCFSKGRLFHRFHGMISSSRVFRVVRFGARNKCKKIVEYWWWKKSCTSWHSEYLFFFIRFRIQHVVQDFFHQPYVPTFFGAMPIPKPKCERFRKLRSKILRRIERDRSWHHHQFTKNVVFFTKTTCQIEAPPNSWTWSNVICSRIFLSSREVAGWFESEIERWESYESLETKTLSRQILCLYNQGIWDPPIRTHLKKWCFSTSLQTKNTSLTKETHPHFHRILHGCHGLPGVSRATSGAGWCGTIGWLWS